MRRILLFSLAAVAAFAGATVKGDPVATQGKPAPPRNQLAAEGRKPPASQANIARLASLLMTQIARCWNPPVGVPDSDLIVTVRFALNEDALRRTGRA
jgi:hypothetical protein